MGIRVVVNPPDLRSRILHLKWRYSMDCRFERDECSTDLSLWLSLHSVALPKPASRDMSLKGRVSDIFCEPIFPFLRSLLIFSEG
jgi:hypothetical protein